MLSLKKSTKLTLAAATFILVPALAFLAITWNQKDSDTQTQAPLVRTYILNTTSGVSFKLTGTVEARVESNLGFRVSGKIVKRFVNAGQTVTKGQKLMEVDVSDFVLSQQAAQAAVAAAKADNVRAIQDEERQRALLEEQAVSQQEYDLAKAIAESTTAKLNAAEANNRQASNQVQYATLKADADGVIVDIPSDVGQVVAAGQTVVRLAQSDTREAVVNVPETMRGYADQATTALLYGDSAHIIDVKLRELSASADTTTRTYQARYTLEGEGQTAALGSTVTVSFAKAAEERADGFQVPVSALHDTGSGSSVWIVDPSTSEIGARSVSVTALGEEFADVTGNLKAGERVVALGAHLLKEKQKVRLADTKEIAGQ